MANPKIRLGRFMQDETGTLYGKIGGLGLGSTNVVSELAISHEGKPYLKLIADPTAASFEIGAAFPKEHDGRKYYSVNLESPVLLAPINAALFPDKTEYNTYNLVWNRSEGPKPSIEADIETKNTRGKHRSPNVSITL